MKTRVLVVDFLNFVYRGAITFGKPVDTAEVSYNIVYNFFRNLRALIEVLDPDKCFLVLEGNPTFRKTLFADYKANRIIKEGSTKADAKADVLRQADIITQLASHLPLTLVKAEAYEADDTIYSLANNLRDEEVVIVSSDSDMIQILQSLRRHDVQLYHPGKKQFITAPEYVYVVWKSLAGDVSDNIPSITSKKKAEHLAVTPTDLQAFLAIEENRADFSLNKQLIELQLVPDDQIVITDYTVDFDKLFAEFDKMHLPSLLTDVYKERFIDTFTALI